MQFLLRLLAALVVGTILGLGATWLTVVRGSMGGEVTDGPWHTSLLAGSAASGPYLRASIAVHGLLALNRSETIYYGAARDDRGAAFDGNCTYRIAGRDPPARWWSITAYGADDYLIPNPANRYSVSLNSVKRNADGSFAITVARQSKEPNWIPVSDGRFSLSLRLYNPQASVAASPATVALPAIEKVFCP
jgi:hypothetical protein